MPVLPCSSNGFSQCCGTSESFATLDVKQLLQIWQITWHNDQLNRLRSISIIEQVERFPVLLKGSPSNKIMQSVAASCRVISSRSSPGYHRADHNFRQPHLADPEPRCHMCKSVSRRLWVMGQCTGCTAPFPPIVSSILNFIQRPRADWAPASVAGSRLRKLLVVQRLHIVMVLAFFVLYPTSPFPI